jgi:hypothetical protein
MDEKEVSLGFEITKSMTPDGRNTLKNAVTVKKIEVNSPASTITITFSQPVKDLKFDQISSAAAMITKENPDGDARAKPTQSPVKFALADKLVPSADFTKWTIPITGTVSGDIDVWIQRIEAALIYDDTHTQLSVKFTPPAGEGDKDAEAEQ